MPNHAPDAPVLVCPLLDEKGHRQGVLAQLLHSQMPHRSLDDELLGNGPKANSSKPLPHRSQNNEILAKSEQDQENILKKVALPSDARGDIVDSITRHDHLDSKQSQLFQRFAELLPTGLAILDHNVSISSNFIVTWCGWCRRVHYRGSNGVHRPKPSSLTTSFSISQPRRAATSSAHGLRVLILEIMIGS